MAVDYQRLNALGDSGDWRDPFTRARYLQFARHTRRDAIDVLDIGCHTGAGGKVLKAALPHLRVVGLDVCPEFISALPTDAYIGGIASSATSIDAADQSFDVVIAGEFIEHLTEFDVDPTIGECYRLLRGLGQFLLTTPNPRYIRLLLTGKSVLGGSHLSQHEPHGLCARLASHGFGRIRVLGSGRVSQLVGERFPLFAAYGSYMLIAEKL